MIRALPWFLALLVLCSVTATASGTEIQKIQKPKQEFATGIKVPKVVGKEIGEAVRILKAANLRAEIKGNFKGDLKGKSSAEIDKMKVGEQEPFAGSRASKNAVITIRPEVKKAATKSNSPSESDSELDKVTEKLKHFGK